MTEEEPGNLDLLMDESSKTKDSAILDESTGSTGRPARSCVGKEMERLGNPIDHTKKAKKGGKVATPTIETGAGVSFFSELEENKYAKSVMGNLAKADSVETPSLPPSTKTAMSTLSATSSVRRRLEAEKEARRKTIELEREDRRLRLEAKLQEQALKLAVKRAHLQDEKDLVDLDLEIEKAKIEEEEGSDEERASGTIRGLSEEEQNLITEFEKECRNEPPLDQRKLIEEQDRKIAVLLQRKEEIAAQFASQRKQKDAEHEREMALVHQQLVEEDKKTANDNPGKSPSPPSTDKRKKPPPPPSPDSSDDDSSSSSDEEGSGSGAGAGAGAGSGGGNKEEGSGRVVKAKQKEAVPPNPVKKKKKSSQKDGFEKFADTIAQAMMKVAGAGGAGNGGGKSTNDKFLARQVQGKDLPHFHGKPEEWPVFLSAFKSSTKSCEYSNADNLARLLKCLKTDALKAVQPLLVDPSNVPNIMKKLEQRFGNPDRIVRALISKLKDTPPVKEYKLETVVEMGIAVDNLVETIKSLKCPEHLSNPQLLEDLTNKFPATYQMRWVTWMQRKKLPKSLTSFAKWMEKETASAIELLPLKSTIEDKKFAQPQGQGHGKKPQNVLANDSPAVAKPKPCRCCSTQGHRHQQCKVLVDMDYSKRSNWVRLNKLCFGCLNFGHSLSECRTKKPCPINGCGRGHHPLLHPPPRQQEPAPQPVAAAGNFGDRILRVGQCEGQALLNVIPVTLSGPKGIVQTFAMLDTGSSYTLLQKEVAVQLGLSGVKDQFQFCWINNETVTEPNSFIVEVDIKGPNQEEFKMTHVRTVEVLKFSRKSVKSSLLKKWKHLSNLDIKPFENGVPTILIGQPHAFLIIPTRRVSGPPNAPVAAETKLGWVLNGIEPYTLDTQNVQAVNFNEEMTTPDQGLHNLVKKFFNTEEFGVDVKNPNRQTKEDSQAEEFFHKNLRKENGRYATRLLWRDENIELPESRSNALRRLYSIEKKMDRDPDFATQYSNNIKEYVDLGYLRKLNEEERRFAGPRVWYLPHFAVSKPSKPDKIRLVFDAAARANGTSLNENLLRGPDKLNPLPSVLFKFRERRIAFTADIKQMFHRVAMDERDQHSQRMLWRGMERNAPPEEYAMSVMTFGATCSPYCAQAVKNENAGLHAEEYPAAADAIIRKHYVDDYLDSCDTVEEGVKRYQEVLKIHAKGNFEICNWITNNCKMSSQIPEVLRSKSQKLLGLEKENLWTERVLGMMWYSYSPKPLSTYPDPDSALPDPDSALPDPDPDSALPDPDPYPDPDSSSDQFRFVTSFHRVPEQVRNGERVPTKREALSMIMSLFDPLGFAACLIVKAKILLQDAWRSKIDWDTQLPDYLHEKWSHLLKEIRRVGHFTIKRCYSTHISSSPDVQLHIFCDASSAAFAAVAYFRVKIDTGFETSLVCAKTRVAPLNPLTIPRLELQGAVMGARLAQNIVENHDIHIHKIHFWTDSKNVMDWISSDARKFNQFVAHRIGEIHEKTNVDNWHWISTLENVADEATRDTRSCDFAPTSRWLNGPSFLKEPEESWPINAPPLDELDPTTREENKQVGAIEGAPHSPPSAMIDVTRFSNWSRLVRATAQVKRFLQLTRRKNTPKEISPENMKDAERYWWKQSQEESYPHELDQMRKNEPMKKGPLSNLSLLFDENGVLRLQGRLPFCPPAANLQINPVVLSADHPYTKLMLDFMHRKYGHHGQEQVVNEIRQEFFIPGLRGAVRKTWNDCQLCKNNRALPKPPQMGMLPLARFGAFLRPFTHTGVDYFGPYEVVVKRSREKRYGALFTCLTTRAIHLEVSHALSTDSFLMTLRRFIARRGNPKEMWSDNGTNFVGANNELKLSLQQLNHDRINEEMNSRAIKWNFIPPLSPFMGGSWERMVRAVKVALSTTMKERHPKDEVLATLFAEAEMVVNGHPLTYIGMDPESPEALTPNHFLLGTSSANQPPGEFDDSDLIPGKQWRIAQRLADFFWKRWIAEFLPTLTRRTKWNQKEDPIKVGDVVIIMDGNLPRNTWPKGIITKVYEKDGQVRVVDVKTDGGTYRRPVHKLCVLDVRRKEDSPQVIPVSVLDEDLHGGKYVAGDGKG